ncbi:hypothetical protein L2E82_36204 [Cichorium intybus]|uniref:Uncharacterized protein n=1 Tax=Cichorium intybus TaxID=13427 RepID=A0ACB9BQW9_CICIN|nr:hypothetical protein L2E82_36204 [Cichorium intybus]
MRTKCLKKFSRENEITRIICMIVSSELELGKGYTRFSASMLQTEGGDSIGISLKPSKKLKTLSSMGKIDQSISTKRVKLPKKFFDDCYTVNHVPVPRKLRSAIKQRYYDVVLQNPKDGKLLLQTPLEENNKKLEVNKEEGQHSTISESISEQITKDEEEAIAGLLLLDGNNNNEEVNLKSETSDSEDFVKNGPVIEDLNKSTKIVDVEKDCKDFRDGNESRKICSRHVYICQMIKQMQVTEVKTVNSHKELVFQDQMHGCGVEARGCSFAQDHTSFQVPTPPYFGSPLYDPSQWPSLRQQIWMNPFMAGARYQNWQKSGLETTQHHSGSNHILPSLLNVLGTKENGGLFLVDSSPTLNLRCNEHLGNDRSWLDDL